MQRGLAIHNYVTGYSVIEPAILGSVLDRAVALPRVYHDRAPGGQARGQTGYPKVLVKRGNDEVERPPPHLPRKRYDDPGCHVETGVDLSYRKMSHTGVFGQWRSGECLDRDVVPTMGQTFGQFDDKALRSAPDTDRIGHQNAK
jgi:hypothetical protein